MCSTPSDIRGCSTLLAPANTDRGAEFTHPSGGTLWHRSSEFRSRRHAEVLERPGSEHQMGVRVTPPIPPGAAVDDPLPAARAEGNDEQGVLRLHDPGQPPEQLRPSPLGEAATEDAVLDPLPVPLEEPGHPAQSLLVAHDVGDQMPAAHASPQPRAGEEAGLAAPLLFQQPDL